MSLRNYSTLLRGLSTSSGRLTGVRSTGLLRAYAATSDAQSEETPASSNKPKRLSLTRQSFPRFETVSIEVSSIIPIPANLEGALKKANVSITPAQLMKLASQFTNASCAKNYEQMLEEWRQEVLQTFNGSLSEITRTATMLTNTSVDGTMGFALCKVAAEEGYVNAAYYYSIMLVTRSFNIRMSRALGTSILKELVSLGHAPSQMLIAESYLRKNSLANKRKAIDLLEKAAVHMPAAAFKLGDAYRKGSPTESDITAAVKWYTHAAKAGVVEGYFALGNMYSRGEGTSDGKPDYKAAFDMFEIAAIRGNVESQYNIGYYYLVGKGVEKDAHLAAEYWGMAAAKRFPIALLNLGKLYAEGKEVPQNIRREQQFPQVVYVSREHYLPGGPILLYSVGERGAQPVDLESSWVSKLAQQTHAAVVLIELRFFGKSIPMPFNDEMLKYLNVEQMTADIREFLAQASAAGLVPKQAPWVLVGGSFAGSLMAWTKYQHAVNALVIASSAPMRVVDGFWEFDNMVSRRLPCTAQLSSAIRSLDAVLDSQNATNINRLKRQFGLDSVDDLVRFSTSLIAQASQLMLESTDLQVSEQITQFCSHFTKTSGVETLASIARTDSMRYRSDPSTRNECPQGDELSWFWLQCTELGLWQTAPPAESDMFDHRLRSRRLSVEYFETQCRRCLSESWNTWKRQWKQGFHTFSQEAFSQYNGKDLFTVGELDPWSALAMHNRQGHDAPEVLVIEGATHAEDLRLLDDDDDNEGEEGVLHKALAVADARRHIADLVQKWSTDFHTHMRIMSNAGGSRSSFSVLRASFVPILTLMCTFTAG
ncbi:hypothetical protein H4R24_001430 [Coemansia sp. RSA 988]|nr:hypothetical protein H4R24_001430 [Coemansia sp. RSA 988]